MGCLTTLTKLNIEVLMLTSDISHNVCRQTSPFKELWDGLGDSIRHLRLVAVCVEPALAV